MTKDRIVTWFVFTNDSHTNKVISSEVPTENMHHYRTCSDGIKRDLWECDGQFITKIRRSKEDMHLIFSIYKRNGKYGQITKADFLEKKKRKIKLAKSG